MCRHYMGGVKLVGVKESGRKRTAPNEVGTAMIRRAIVRIFTGPATHAYGSKQNKSWEKNVKSSFLCIFLHLDTGILVTVPPLDGVLGCTLVPQPMLVYTINLTAVSRLFCIHTRDEHQIPPLLPTYHVLGLLKLCRVFSVLFWRVFITSSSSSNMVFVINMYSRICSVFPPSCSTLSVLF